MDNSIIGARFGSLVVINEVPNQNRVGDKRGRCYTCQCDCGLYILARGTRLRAGTKVVCSRKCVATHTSTKRALYPDEYRIWKGIRERCDPKSGSMNYGGKGIKRCQRWSSFDLFIEDMGPKPTKYHTIDRIDSTGDYEPSNCRWATRKEQTRNISTNVWLEFNGKRMILSDWAKELNIKQPTLSRRLRVGWSIEKALTTPVRP